MKNLMYVLIAFALAFGSGCNKDDETPEKEEEKQTIIQIGDTIDQVEEVYGSPDVSGSFFHEVVGEGTVSGYMWWYMDLELRFIFDDSSPRKVTYIDGTQPGES